MDFSDVVKAQQAGASVRRARLVDMDFVSGRVGVWNGFRTLTTSDGREWLGAFGLGKIEPVKQSHDGSAPELRLSLSAVTPKMLAWAVASRADYYRRRVVLYSQYFYGWREIEEGDDPAEVLAEWSPVGPPFAEAWALMMGFVYRREAVDGGSIRTITLSAETPFGATRIRPPNAYCTDTDQKARYPGDRIFERVAINEARNIEFYPQ